MHLELAKLLFWIGCGAAAASIAIGFVMVALNVTAGARNSNEAWIVITRYKGLLTALALFFVLTLAMGIAASLAAKHAIFVTLPI